MIWALFGVIMAIAAFLILVKPNAKGLKADPISHYKEQLAEIEADMDRGILDVDSASAAKLEIERRILRLANNKGSTEGRASLTAALIPVVVFVLLGSGLGYYYLGNPSISSQPSALSTIQNTPISEGGPTFKEALEKIEKHLSENPDDIKGWQMMATTAKSVGDYSRAARAFQNIVGFIPNEARWRVELLESYMAMAQGKITPAAKLVLASLLQLEPEHPAGHFYLGVSRLQDGDRETAKSVWLALAERSPANAPWMSAVNEQLSKLGVAPPKLTQAQIDAVAVMNDEERQAFIMSMMERLQLKLESNPNDVKGWLMLARSQASIGQKQVAIDTLKHALGVVEVANRPKLQALLDKLLLNGDL